MLARSVTSCSFCVGADVSQGADAEREALQSIDTCQLEDLKDLRRGGPVLHRLADVQSQTWLVAVRDHTVDRDAHELVFLRRQGAVLPRLHRDSAYSLEVFGHQPCEPLAVRVPEPPRILEVLLYRLECVVQSSDLLECRP